MNCGDKKKGYTMSNSIDKMSSQSEKQTPFNILAASILIFRYYFIDTSDHILIRYISEEWQYPKLNIL
jgi:hypothetical protein